MRVCKHSHLKNDVKSRVSERILLKKSVNKGISDAIINERGNICIVRIVNKCVFLKKFYEFRKEFWLHIISNRGSFFIIGNSVLEWLKLSKRIFLCANKVQIVIMRERRNDSIERRLNYGKTI